MSSTAPRCQGTETVTQNCLAGGQRRCERCTGILLHPHADRMGWVTGTIKVSWVEPAPVDCTQACPADEWMPLLPRLATVLAGRRFSGVLADEGPVVFRSASGSAREQRRRRAGAAAARKQEEVDALWDRLTAGGGQASQCGWRMLHDEDPARARRVMEAMLQMQKIDLRALKAGLRRIDRT